MGSSLVGVWLIHSVSLHWWKLISSFLAAIGWGGTPCPFSSVGLRFWPVWAYTGPVCAAKALWAPTCISPAVLGKMLSLVTISGSYNLSALFSPHRSWVLREGCVKDIWFRAMWSNVSPALNVVQLWVSVLIITYSKRKLLWWGSSDALSYWYITRCHWESFHCYSFSRVIAVGFPLGPMIDLVSGSWPS